jgi:hypothetical protein
LDDVLPGAPDYSQRLFGGHVGSLGHAGGNGERERRRADLNRAKPSAKHPAPDAAKSPAAERMKACSAYGAGFVQVPGSDACVKIGGFVTMEGTAH